MKFTYAWLKCMDEQHGRCYKL